MSAETSAKLTRKALHDEPHATRSFHGRYRLKLLSSSIGQSQDVHGGSPFLKMSCITRDTSSELLLDLGASPFLLPHNHTYMYLRQAKDRTTKTKAVMRRPCHSATSH